METILRSELINFPYPQKGTNWPPLEQNSRQHGTLERPERKLLAMSKLEKNILLTVPGDWFRQDLLMPVFGISTEAARKYRSSGLWLEGRHWRWDPARRVVYSRKAIEAWMEGQL